MISLEGPFKSMLHTCGLHEAHALHTGCASRRGFGSVASWAATRLTATALLTAIFIG